MIENNNYFKVRDIAKLINCWCEFTGKTVILDRNFFYADEAAIAAGAKRESAKDENGTFHQVNSGLWVNNFEYEGPDAYATYSGTPGRTESNPVAYFVRDPWGNYDYTKLYFGETNAYMNALAQLILDCDIIAKNDEGVTQFNDGNTLNKYYRYPMVECDLDYYGGSDKFIPVPMFEFSMGYDTNFGERVMVRQISNTAVGVMSIEHDERAGAVETRRDIIAERRKEAEKYVAPIIAKMETYGSDAEKIIYLASEVGKKWFMTTRQIQKLLMAERFFPFRFEVMAL